MPMDPEKDKSYVGDVDVMDNLENGDDRETHKIRSRSGKPLEKYLFFFRLDSVACRYTSFYTSFS